MGETRPFWLAGEQVTGEAAMAVTRKYDGAPLAEVAVPTPDQVEAAVAAAHAVRQQAQALPAHLRADALAHVGRRIEERAAEAAELITAENGKPIRWARGEVSRAVSTFRFAAEEARRWGGELQRLDTDAGGAGRVALVRRFPYGPVLGIAPFNFPLNLVAHKVAPALAVGAPIIVKPAPATPLSALWLGELLAEIDLPAGMWSVLPVPNDAMAPLVADPRLPVISFTGSGPVGWGIKQAAPAKQVTLELGGNAAAVVTADANLDYAAARIATFATYQAGQSCISVQRVYADRAIHDALVDRVVAAVAGMRTGDPTDPDCEVGPLISEEAARRVESWVDEAVAGGAKVLTGGTRQGNSYEPTVLVEVPAGAKVLDEEIFGPVLAIAAYDTLDEAFALVNDSAYGLQAGVFTRDIATAFRAHRDLEVGGVVIGDVPTYRADQMPYGGAKASGVGREGLRYAMTDFTYDRVLVLTGLDL